MPRPSHDPHLLHVRPTWPRTSATLHPPCPPLGFQPTGTERLAIRGCTSLLKSTNRSFAVSVWVPALKTISSLSASRSSTSTGSPKRLPNGGMEPTSHAGKVSRNSDSWANRTSSEPSTAPTFLRSTRRSAGSTTMTRSPEPVVYLDDEQPRLCRRYGHLPIRCHPERPAHGTRTRRRRSPTSSSPGLAWTLADQAMTPAVLSAVSHRASCRPVACRRPARRR